MTRRALPILALFVATSCATPPVRVSPAFPAGQQRTYDLDARATTRTSTAAGDRTERTHLRARSILDLLAPTENGTSARLQIMPISLTRNGTAVETPNAQTADLVIRHSGAIDVVSVDGVPGSLLPTGAADVADLLGPPLPGHALRAGERFSGKGLRGRVAALRIERGFPCAILRLGQRRLVQRERDEDGRRITLDGSEVSDIEMAFALREGFPVRIHTTAEAPLRVRTDGQESGRIIVRTVTTLTLIEPRPR